MKPNLTSSLVDELRRRIVEGEIAPGEKLPSESALINERGVSRTVVREALTRLQVEGLVHTRRGAGSFALTPPPSAAASGIVRPARTLEERLELLGYRLALEPEAAALAADRLGAAQLPVLRAELEAFGRAAGNPSEALAHDFAFHRAVAEASGNRYLLEALDTLGPAMISMPRRRLDAAAEPALDGDAAPGREAATAPDRFQQVAAEHAAVLAAIEEGDALGAAAAMRAHLQNSRRRLRSEAGN